MKKIFILMAIVMSVSTANAQAIYVLPNGKSIPIRLATEVYSNVKSPIDVKAIVDADIKDDSGTEVLIRRGTPVVLDADIKKARGVGKPAFVQLNFLNTTSVDGQIIRLQGGYNKRGESRRGVALGVGLGVGLTVCWPCMFCLCIKGDTVTIPENRVFNNVVVNDNYRISTTR